MSTLWSFNGALLMLNGAAIYDDEPCCCPSSSSSSSSSSSASGSVLLSSSVSTSFVGGGKWRWDVDTSVLEIVPEDPPGFDATFDFSATDSFDTVDCGNTPGTHFEIDECGDPLQATFFTIVDYDTTETIRIEIDSDDWDLGDDGDFEYTAAFIRVELTDDTGPIRVTWLDNGVPQVEILTVLGDEALIDLESEFVANRVDAFSFAVFTVTLL